MALAHKDGRITFNGRLSDDIRRRIREKRLQLGLPYRVLAVYFNSSWSTIRKWEYGPTRYCSLSLRPRLEAFLNGDCDADLLQQMQLVTPAYALNCPESMQCCMERIGTIYALLHSHPELRERFLREVESVSQSILQQLVTADAGEYCLLDNMLKNG